VPCHCWASLWKPHGSFLPPVAFVRSRGSPNFLQLGDS
jgi:hypothetical protein